MSIKRILLAESDPLYRQAITDAPARIKDIEVPDKVGTGWQVVQLSAQLNPDLVLMDFNLLGLNGGYEINQATAGSGANHNTGKRRKRTIYQRRKAKWSMGLPGQAPIGPGITRTRSFMI